MTGRLWAPKQCWLAVWFSRCIAPCKDWREYSHTGDEGGTNRKTGKKRGFGLLSSKKSSLYWEWWISLMGTGKCWSLPRLAAYAVSQEEGVKKTKEALLSVIVPLSTTGCLSSQVEVNLGRWGRKKCKGTYRTTTSNSYKNQPKLEKLCQVFFPLASEDKLGLTQNNLQDDTAQKMSLCPLQGLKIVWPRPPIHLLWSSISKTISGTDTDPTSISIQWAFHWEISVYISVEALSMKAEVALQQGDNPGPPWLVIFWPCFAASP